MKKKLQLQVQDDDQRQRLEILKAVAQAWYGHSGSSRSTNEFDAHRRNFKSRPSRFKIEATNESSAKKTASSNWDFSQSLWDSYELVTVSKKLEAELVLDNPFSGIDNPRRVHKQRRESKNSLKNLFSRFSSRRFNEGEVDTQF